MRDSNECHSSKNFIFQITFERFLNNNYGLHFKISDFKILCLQNHDFLITQLKVQDLSIINVNILNFPVIKLFLVNKSKEGSQN